MKRFNRTLIVTACLSLFAASGGVEAQTAKSAFDATALPSLAAMQQATPFQNNNGYAPPPGYTGPLFSLNHDWPKFAKSQVGPPPWRKAINNGRINIHNAEAYANALKEAVAPNARKLILDYAHWDAAKAGWYNEPWLGSLRDAIHGTYQAGVFGDDSFPGTGLKVKFQTNVLTYYDPMAALTLRSFWGADAMTPALNTRSSQFMEDAIIVKAAVFSSTDKDQPRDWWPVLKGAAEWPMMIPINSHKKPPDEPTLWTGYVAQFDIIVKDRASSPDTGWVFMTLVYDADAPGKDAWDKMVPLGVQWGNDEAAGADPKKLVENWNNPKAPKYSTQTLGWGDRLSGPNDGARNNIAFGGKSYKNYPDSSCMSCHSTAEWNTTKNRMMSFLLPSYYAEIKDPDKDPGFKTCNEQGKEGQGDAYSYICSPVPGSAEWMKWFKNRKGDVAMDPGSFATDFDEVFSFKALKLWYTATNPQKKPAPQLKLLSRPGAPMEYNQYTGAPLPSDDK
ncbi:MAG: hypothetical protein GAK28_01303 [Luteibacter sp.]|uniref:hypothetical protein n=1 Tax=Luteibacter sp. TaxID=1886636 RepID=UPI0013835B7C|nr:hypothetical protein [Luteibacter sp.]KAF1008322.1 MAG: hypothetical protein GAK28_01303 [Luteibacter sp.]